MTLPSTSFPCQLCLKLLRQRPSSLPTQPVRRAFHHSRSSSTSSPSSSRISPLLATYKSQQAHRLLQLKALQTQATELLKTARGKSSAVVQAWELERRAREMGGKINEATGYGEIERLRKGVGKKEKALEEVREAAITAKKAYTAAMSLRTASQREVNDLLQRKSTWSSADVMRFTELIQQDHENEKAEVAAKDLMDAGEEGVEKRFSDLMQAILERYHEEQVWSDKIRSLSTYGSLAITSLNVLLFIIAILLVEPWKRKRLVEGVESRLRMNTQESQLATLSSLTALQDLLQSAQIKLDLLVPQIITTAAAIPSFGSSIVGIGMDEVGQVQGFEEITTYPFSSASPEVEVDEDEPLLVRNESEGAGSTGIQLRGTELRDVTVEEVRERKQRERELWIVGAAGTILGIGVSLLSGILSR